MPRCLLVVEERFRLGNRRLVLAPGIFPVEGERIGVGDRVVLARPDGSIGEAAIRGISSGFRPDSAFEVHVLLDLTSKGEVPIGTEVWSIGP